MSTRFQTTASCAPARVNLSEDWNFHYWTTTLGCSVQELNTAIARVGTSSRALSHFFSRPQHNKGK